MRIALRRRSLTCKRAVELMADYLDEALPPSERRDLERHLRDCPHCGEYLRQLRATIAATGQIDTDDLSPEMRDALVSLYRKTMKPESKPREH
jgi:anti-sigma factor RsiW